MKCGMILNSGGSKSPSATKNRLRKAFSGRILWNSARLGQALVESPDASNGFAVYRAAPVHQKKRSKVMARVRAQRDRRAMIAMARRERRESRT